MKAQNVVVGQRVGAEKAEAARLLRQQSTPAEALLWARLRGNQLDGLHFRRQQVIDGFIVDFYCLRAGLVVEVDGEVHGQQTDSDAERTEILSARGLRVLRVTNRMVEENIEGVLRSISDACEV